MASVYNSIITKVQEQVDGLGLLLGATAVTTAVRKLPRAEETLDILPLICVCPDVRAEESEPFTFDGTVTVAYYVEIVIISAGNRDFSDNNLNTYLDWRQQIRRLYQGTTLAQVDEVYQTDMLPGTPLDRAQLNQNYNYSPTTVRFHACEVRS